MSDEFEDMEGYDAPAVTLERFLIENPRYAEQKAAEISADLVGLGAYAGKILHDRIRRTCRAISDQYGDIVMSRGTQALKMGLPPDVAQNLQELVQAGEDEEEIWDDAYFEVTADAIQYFVKGFLPYVLSMPLIMGEALDYNFPMPISDEIREAYEKLQGKIPDPPSS